MSLYVTFRDLFATFRCHSLAYALSLAFLSFLGLLGSPYCLILPSSLVLWFCCLVYLAGGSFAAGHSFIAVVYSYASPVYVVLDF